MRTSVLCLNGKNIDRACQRRMMEDGERQHMGTFKTLYNCSWIEFAMVAVTDGPAH